MLFIKKNCIYKEKSGTVTKVKLLRWNCLREFKKPNIQQLYFGTFALAPHCTYGDKT